MREDAEGRRKGVQAVSGTAGLRDVAGSDFRPVPPGTLASAGGWGHSRRLPESCQGEEGDWTDLKCGCPLVRLQCRKQIVVLCLGSGQRRETAALSPRW